VPEPIPPGGLILDGAGARIELETSCFERISWRCVLREPPAEYAAVVEALVARGYTQLKRIPTLLEVFHPKGHRVAIVPATGRIQLRVSTEIPEEQRPEVALALADELAQVAGEQR
jgi:hypothetical protein